MEKLLTSLIDLSRILIKLIDADIDGPPYSEQRLQSALRNQ